jgi:hypothetical protein
MTVARTLHPSTVLAQVDGRIGGTSAPAYAMDIVASSPQIRVGNSAGPEVVLFGNDSHGIARNPNISTFTDVNDVVMFTAGS